MLADSTPILNNSKQKKGAKISYRSAFEAMYPGVRVLSFDFSAAAKAQELAAILSLIVQDEWTKGADGMFDENDMIDCSLVIYWSNNDGAKQAGETKKCPTGCIDAYTPLQLAHVGNLCIKAIFPTRCLYGVRDV